ncbi:MAG TPA: phage capsid protein [Dongiaceae bacterium]|nr:phage capsid protein [Dongiaceae bacterium]
MNTQFQAYQRQFEDTLTHLFEIDRPYVVDALTVDTEIKGMTKVFKRIGQLQGQDKTGRNEIAILDEPDYSARHLNVKTKYVATPVDMEDVFKMVNDPKSDIYTECVHAIYDLQTTAAMNSFFSDVVINEDGGATSSFPAANVIAVNFSTGTFGQNSGAADVGLNLDKLLKVRSLISQAGVRVNTSELNQLQIAVCEDDIQSLLASKIGTDNFPMIDRLNTMMVQLEKVTENIIDGKFRWNGFTFNVVPPEFFLLDDSGMRRVPVWIKDGVVFGIKENVATEIEKLPNTVESYKIQALTRVGGMRKHDKKVYDIRVKP